MEKRQQINGMCSSRGWKMNFIDQVPASPRTWKYTFPGLTSGSPNQEPTMSVLTCTLGDSDAPSSLRITAMHHLPKKANL